MIWRLDTGGMGRGCRGGLKTPRNVISARRSCSGIHAMIPAPTYGMFRAMTEQRGAVATLAPGSASPRAMPLSSRPCARGTQCRAALALLTEQPDRAGRAGRRDRDPARPDRGRCGRRRSAGADRRDRRGVCRVRGSDAGGPAVRPPEPHRHPDSQQGLRPGGSAGRFRHRPTGAGRSDRTRSVRRGRSPRYR